jgi:hypothetical protein
MDFQVFGFAVEENYDSSYLSFETYATQNRKSSEIMHLEPYDCTEEVYKNLSTTVGKDLPSHLQIKCVKISTQLFNQGFDPTFTLIECMGKGDNCKPAEERNRVLKELWIWVFTLTDETDYTKSSKHDFKTNFQAKSLPVSNTLKKFSHLSL